MAGRVQGVSYRAGTRAKALQLGLTGFARNLDDGRVEVLACGEADKLADLERWLHKGPSLAVVTKVEAEAAAAPPDLDGFKTA
ncbi:acylphosphatase [Alkalilimnicola ehrlichii]|uniref:acylphosphatase n=1 Tax=Alkalilimnicola ehrlichii TaxID=351052 RepID=A0A3E0X0Q0_9GAMM|nr:acylphosphatase [Alkalilimnicola ehrlichii]RFA37991.1 hypothetical protein CAL65_06395 [Alkalilimnicola ehrlichii]